MSIVGKNFKICASCAYFNGKRTIPCKNFVEYNSAEVGKCYRVFPQGIDKKPMYSCGDWECWAAIR